MARIFEEAENGTIQLVASPAHQFENDRNPREDRRLATALWLQKAGRSITVTPRVEERARFLSGLGFGPLDALHLALAEHAQAQWFVTTDDRLIRKALEQRGQMRIKVVRPDEMRLGAEEDEK